MKIRLSNTIGFCYGVKQAVELSKKALSKKNGRVFSVGHVIHNPQVVKELKGMGLEVVYDTASIKNGTVIISSHGAGAKLKESQKSNKLNIIDATCPIVKKIQKRVRELYSEGYTVVIVGKEEHPEVRALVDFTNGKAKVIDSVGAARSIKLKALKVGIVSQSTYSRHTFEQVASILSKKGFHELKVFDTICKDTIKRQDDVRKLTASTDVIFVVGGKNSSNTRRLLEVCRENKNCAYHIEEAQEIDPLWLTHKESVGIASGASTPDWVVDGVVRKIKNV